MPVYEGDVQVLDEVTQLATADLLRIQQIALRPGAMVVGTLDTEQLGFDRSCSWLAG